MDGDVETDVGRHTGGRWTVITERGVAGRNAYDREFLVGTAEKNVATCRGSNLDPDDVSIGEARANACLIAAAPDLFNAAIGAIEHMEHSTAQGRVAYEFLRLAIARATGEPGTEW